jgi:3-keto-disaccharide hydrolase
MKRLLFGALALLALSASGTASAEKVKPTAEDDKGWVQLFNGKDLDGWVSLPEDKARWSVKDGAIVGEGGVGHLYTERGDYENFDFKIEAMISDGGNSGQYFRTKKEPGFPKGYEAQINSTHGDPQRTGSLYNIVKITKQLHKPDEWFTQEVIADGDHIIIKVNDETVVDTHDSKYSKGHLAIQQHNEGSVVHVRKAEIKELPPTKAEVK